MPNTVHAANETESESIIFGAGATVYPWWVSAESDWEYDSISADAPAGWMWRVTIKAPYEDGDIITKEIRHKDLMAACRKISGKDFQASSTLKKHCRNMAFNVDDVDMDASDADAVLQVAMLGDILW
ncbi:hypothetical protein [Nocardia brasiliensis]|uniref:hypothetical protein n=1 Tax=Nocardia brasiliensis TaxID=37326 RepID=UPI0024583D17|nr:hypothetical protein [Nocardia brasiliensis]